MSSSDPLTPGNLDPTHWDSSNYLFLCSRSLCFKYLKLYYVGTITIYKPKKKPTDSFSNKQFSQAINNAILDLNIRVTGDINSDLRRVRYNSALQLKEKSAKLN